MNTSNLKIGNHVFDDLNEIVKIELLYSPFFMEWAKHEFPVAFSKYGNDRDIFESVINPIPLTTPMLKKMGFATEGYLNGFIGKEYKVGTTGADFVLKMPNENIEYFSFDLNNFVLLELEYVHEVQNLYSAITGQELSLF